MNGSDRGAVAWALAAALPAASGSERPASLAHRSSCAPIPAPRSKKILAGPGGPARRLPGWLSRFIGPSRFAGNPLPTAVASCPALRPVRRRPSLPRPITSPADVMPGVARHPFTSAPPAVVCPAVSQVRTRWPSAARANFPCASRKTLTTRRSWHFNNGTSTIAFTAERSCRARQVRHRDGCR